MVIDRAELQAVLHGVRTASEMDVTDLYVSVTPEVLDMVRAKDYLMSRGERL